MFRVRPIQAKDIDPFVRFALGASLGMNSLPRDRNLLVKKIERSENSFQKAVKAPEDEIYFFVIEDVSTQEVGGCCGIYAKTGVSEPLYFFYVDTEYPSSESTPLPKEIKMLHPISEINGPSEICGLYLTPDWRSKGVGQLLSLSRYLFIAEHPHRFDHTLMARLRGLFDKDTNTSPFWDGIGKHFVDLTFKEAQEKLDFSPNFVADFLPKYPIYVSMLPKKTRDAIEKINASSKPAEKLLKREGFKLTHCVDIFDAGPVFEVEIQDIRAINAGQRAVVKEITQNSLNSKQYIISNTSLDFAATYGKVERKGQEGVILEAQTAAALNVKIGSHIRYTTMQ